MNIFPDKETAYTQRALMILVLSVFACSVMFHESDKAKVLG